MNNKEIKKNSIEKINKAVKQLIEQGEKINEANVIRLSGLGRSTVQRLWKNDSSKKTDSPKNDSPESKKDIDKSVAPTISVDSKTIPEKNISNG